MLPSSVKEIILSWHGSVLGKIGRRFVEQHLYFYFGQFRRQATNWPLVMILSNQRLKFTLLFTLIEGKIVFILSL